MRIPSRLPSCGALLLLVLAASATAQNPLDARTAKRIAEKEVELEAAREKLEKANDELQAIYAELSESWTKVSTGQAAEIFDDLERGLAEVFAEVQAAAKENGGNASRVGGAWDKGQARSLREFQTPFARLMTPRIREAGASLSRDAAGDLATWTLTDFVRALAERAFPGATPFHEVWNTALVERVDAVKRYVAARTTLRGVESELMVLHDPKKAFAIDAPEGMAKIPGGAVTVESLHGYEAKRRKARVQTFLIDLHEVTHGAYWRDFHVKLTESADRERHLPRDAEGRPLWDQELSTGVYQPAEDLMMLPVTGVDAVSAAAYAAAVGKRLPTEAEWVAAASGSTRGETRYAWGDTYERGRCNDAIAALGAVMPSDSLPEGRSAYGLFHVCGNVKEWTATTADGDDLVDGMNPEATIAVRGGGFREGEDGVSLQWRWKLPAAGSRADDLGFRCARDWRP